MFVQVKAAGAVETTAFDLEVTENQLEPASSRLLKHDEERFPERGARPARREEGAASCTGARQCAPRERPRGDRGVAPLS